MRHAYPVREDQVPQHGARGLLVRVVADDPAIAPGFQAIHRPIMHLVPDRRFAEEDAAVRRDIQVVGQLETRIVDDRKCRPVGLVGQLGHLPVPADPIQPHAADAAQQSAVFREGHAEGASADMGEDFLAGIVGRKEPDDVAGAGPCIDVVVVVEDNVFRPVDFAKADQRDIPQLVVQRIG